MVKAALHSRRRCRSARRGPLPAGTGRPGGLSARGLSQSVAGAGVVRQQLAAAETGWCVNQGAATTGGPCSGGRAVATPGC